MLCVGVDSDADSRRRQDPPEAHQASDHQSQRRVPSYRRPQRIPRIHRVAQGALSILPTFNLAEQLLFALSSHISRLRGVASHCILWVLSYAAGVMSGDVLLYCIVFWLRDTGPSERVRLRRVRRPASADQRIRGAHKRPSHTRCACILQILLSVPAALVVPRSTGRDGKLSSSIPSPEPHPRRSRAFLFIHSLAPCFSSRVVLSMTLDTHLIPYSDFRVGSCYRPEITPLTTLHPSRRSRR